MTTGETRLLSELVQQVAIADAARRHAQAVSSALVREKRALQATLGAIKEALLDRYDGAPDSTTKWMGVLIQDIEGAPSAPAETIGSVTTWADETFGQAMILSMIERAKKEWDELLYASLHDMDRTAEEAADVCICLYRVIGTLDPEAINKKMAKNRARKWQVDRQGCAQHVGE